MKTPPVWGITSGALSARLSEGQAFGSGRRGCRPAGVRWGQVPGSGSAPRSEFHRALPGCLGSTGRWSSWDAPGVYDDNGTPL